MSEIITDATSPLSSLPRIVFFDIDGTLVNSAHKIGKATQSALKRLNALGVKTALASGRASYAARELIREFNFNAPSLFFAGALVIDPQTNEVLHEAGIAAQLAGELVEKLSQAGIYYELHDAEDYYVPEKSRFSALHAEYMGRHATITDPQTIIKSKSILKLEAITLKGADELEFRELLRNYGQIDISTAFGMKDPETAFHNITSKGASRARAFHLILDKLSLTPQDVMSFGDSEPDLTFIELAGCGIALGNASKAVQERARYVTRSVDQDGVGYALERLVLSGRGQ